MPAAGVGGHRQHRPVLARHDLSASADIDVALRQHRVAQAVALLGVVGVVEKRVDGLVALEIHDPEDLPLLNLMHPRRSGWVLEVEDRIGGIERAFDDAHVRDSTHK